MSIWRSIGAVAAGVFVTGIVITVFQLVGHAIFPPPDGLMQMRHEELRVALAGAPPLVFIPVLLGHFVGPLVGGLVAAWLAPQARLAHALVIGFLFTLTGLMNVFLIPQPLWVSAASLACFLPAALLGGKLAIRMLRTDDKATQSKPLIYEPEE